VTGVSVVAAAAMTLLPVAAEPVKNRWSRSSAANSLLTSASPVTTATSSTSKASCQAFASTSAVRGIFSDILIITRLPAASADSAGTAVRLSGKFHIPMTPTTPSGVGCTSARTPASRIAVPSTAPPIGRDRIQRPTPARWISASAANATTSVTSVLISPRNPKSAEIASTISSVWETTAWANLSMRSLRTASDGGPSRWKAARWRASTSDIGVDVVVALMHPL